ncbi:MAG TPA: preprotein translocase subunit YajC [Microbacteriaceae bacterium]|nr:preprotein translocase subunit YajC [Microbacteriaceae bacterium]
MPKLRRGAAALLLLASPFVLTACSSLMPPATTQPDSAATAAPGADGAAPAQTGPDWLLIGMVVLLGVMVFFMFRNSRKRKAEQEKLKGTMVPGVEVMTNFGLFGTIIELDEVANTAILELSPGNRVKVHRQTLVRIVEPAGEGSGPRSVEEAMEIADREQRERDAAAGEPRYGERIDPEDEGDQKQ